jgi:MFS family permease
MIGLLLAGLFIDRIGKRRGTMIGVLVGAVLFALIPFFQQTIWSIRFILVLTTIAVEFSFTAVIPLFAEQAPEARATVFSIVALGNVIGSAVAAPTTSSLWIWGGLDAIVTTGVLASLIAFLLIWKYLQDNQQGSAFS